MRRLLVIFVVAFALSACGHADRDAPPAQTTVIMPPSQSGAAPPSSVSSYSTSTTTTTCTPGLLQGC
ncbi:MAG TPA: hypothetical protein VFC38_05610 [Stellaceae bacterium]|nr:hypothetical protein [Stellaceae bacterium]